MATKPIFPYEWKIASGYPAAGIEKHGKKCFGTFICGGGSTMGYKLAGYDHLGGVELDPEIASIYKTNHNPKYFRRSRGHSIIALTERKVGVIFYETRKNHQTESGFEQKSGRI